MLCSKFSGRVCGPVKWLLKQNTRLMSSSTHLSLTVDDKSGVATLAMKKKPVNSLNLEMLTDLNIALDKLEGDKSIKGMILTSELPKIFSAGLDIMEMYQPEPNRLREFWRTVQDFWLKLYGSNLVTIAAINGNSPAGGCLAALSCDYRIMADGPFSIGLNETKLGIVAPTWFEATLKNTIGHRQAERGLALGYMFNTQEALNIGMVDAVVPQDSLIEAVTMEMSTWLKIPETARIITKHQLRDPTLNVLQMNRDADIDNFVSFITKPGIQKAMGMYIEMLKKKSEAKKTR